MDTLDRRLPLYNYLRPLIEGRRVLEIGGGPGRGAEHLASLGAAAVVSADDNGVGGERSRARVRSPQITFVPSLKPAALEELGLFDLVVVPDGVALLRGGTSAGGLTVALLRRLVTPAGRVVVLASSGDRRDARNGIGFYELSDALVAAFPVVRMFGQTPFSAIGMAEFDGGSAGLQVDSTLVDADAEEPTHYIAIAGADDGPALGYALIQVPSASATPAGPQAPPASDVQRQLAEAETRADGATRVARAQAEEIEELRARVRRAAEARAELDTEVARLRQALTQADESVMSLTRRTTEEMTSLAQRLTAGLRGGIPAEDGTRSPELGAVLERLREREATLAARESALAERDERIAALETEKQDLLWRAQSAEERFSDGGPRVAELQALVEHREQRIRALERTIAETREGLVSRVAAEAEDIRTALATRERALEEFRRAAVAHVDDVARMRAQLAEQETLVSELEEALGAADARRATAEHEAERLRKALAAAEEADRSRRSRLSELEGKLLRLSHERQAAAVAAREVSPEVLADFNAKLAAAERVSTEQRQRIAALEASIVEENRGRIEAERRWAGAVEQMVGIEQQSAAALAEKDDLVLDREALRARLEELEAGGPGSPAALRVAEQDVLRLRSALERSEEALHQARAQLFPLRGRIATLEQAESARDVTERTFVRRVLDDVAAIEAGLRAEGETVAGLERELSALVALSG